MLGANVQEDQLVTVGASLGQEEMAREVAAAAYRRGARFVDVTYFDAYAKRARIEHARAETLDFVPSWFGDRMLELGRQRAARISLSGPAPPDALVGLDPERAGRDQLPFIKEVLTVISERLVNWTVVPAPTLEWAQLVYPELAGHEALECLWKEIGHVCRLDEPDP
ncbi:MAG: aminopeptidase, partial [Solirubrobacteraceae bacterium]